MLAASTGVPGSFTFAFNAESQQAADALPRDRGDKIPVQASWSVGTIEQHGHARIASKNLDNDPSLAGQRSQSSGSEFTDLEASADDQSIEFLHVTHNFAPR